MTARDGVGAAGAASTPPRSRVERRRALQARRRRFRHRCVSVGCVFVLLAALAVVGVVVSGRLRLAFVQSGSMRPTIPVGALAVYVPASAGDLRPGDVIAFHPPGRRGTVTHRVVAVEHRHGTHRFVTQGDANSSPDPWTVRERGTGWRYVGRVPVVGYAVGYLATAAARLVVILGLTGFVLWELWRPRRSISVAAS